MLSAEQRLTRLQELLDRVKRNREFLADEKTAAAEAAPFEAESDVSGFAPVETLEVVQPAVVQTATPARKVPEPTMAEVSVPGDYDGEEGVRTFESTPRATQEVVMVRRAKPRADWTLKAVLERAWKLGFEQ